MEPKKEGFEDVFPFQFGDFWGLQPLIFKGVRCSWSIWPDFELKQFSCFHPACWVPWLYLVGVNKVNSTES